MLLYIYLLYLLVCIESLFCYDCISDGSDLKSKRVFGKRKPSKNKRIFKRQEYEASEEGGEERGPAADIDVADIDVASFVQRPDYGGLGDNQPYGTGLRNRKHLSNDYGDYGTLTKLEEDNSQKKDKSYLDDSHQEYNLQEFTSNVEHGPEEDVPVDKNNNKARKPKKKSLSKKIKVPFFSHKSDSLKTNKNKKRKLFKNSSKKKITVSSSFPEQNKVSKRNSDLYDLNKKKRSYQEHICAICQRKFFTSVKDAPNSKSMVNNVIHNSRQYFQAVEEKNRDKMKQGSTNNISEAEEDDKAPDDATLQVNEERIKREEDDKERQLKELEEVQKRIDNVEVNMPVYQKPG